MIKLRYIYLCLGLSALSFEAGLMLNKEKPAESKKVLLVVDDPECNYRKGQKYPAYIKQKRVRND